ncbi:MAG: ribonuclease [Haloplasmataceae bacterium]|jgi:ribonuclease HIII|nr:ribonuclease [Haloplasmataceae bacterium]
MSSITIQVSETTINKMIIFYEDCLLTNNNPHALFSAKAENCTITAYKSHKVLFQGEGADNEASIWTTITNQTPTKVTPTEFNYYLPSIGSDEVGTGDYFGPVVVVAAYIDEQNINEIKKLRIDDSKKLTDEHIIKIAPTLFKLLPYSLLVVNNEKYNEVMTGDMNLNKLKAVLHKQAITNLQAKINKAHVNIIIDQFSSIDNFNRYVKDTTFSKKVNFQTKAESKFASVACASMMARYIFLQEMDKLSSLYLTTILKGASDKVNAQAQTLVNKHGRQVLTKIAKLHFKNTLTIKD